MSGVTSPSNQVVNALRITSFSFGGAFLIPPKSFFISLARYSVVLPVAFHLDTSVYLGSSCILAYHSSLNFSGNEFFTSSTSKTLPVFLAASTSAFINCIAAPKAPIPSFKFSATVAISPLGVVAGALVPFLAFGCLALALVFSFLAFLLAASSSFNSSCFVRFLTAASSARPSSVICSGDLKAPDFVLCSVIPSVSASVCTCSSTSRIVVGLGSLLTARSIPSATFSGVSASIPSVRKPFLNLLPLTLTLYVSALPDRRCKNIASASLVCIPVFLFTA